MRKTIKLYGVVDTNDPSSWVWSVETTARAARKTEGLSWAVFGQDWEGGWKDAKKHGRRVIPLEVTFKVPPPRKAP